MHAVVGVLVGRKAAALPVTMGKKRRSEESQQPSEVRSLRRKVDKLDECTRKMASEIEDLRRKGHKLRTRSREAADASKTEFLRSAAALRRQADECRDGLERCQAALRAKVPPGRRGGVSLPLSVPCLPLPCLLHIPPRVRLAAVRTGRSPSCASCASGSPSTRGPSRSGGSSSSTIATPPSSRCRRSWPPGRRARSWARRPRGRRRRPCRRRRARGIDRGGEGGRLQSVGPA